MLKSNYVILEHEGKYIPFRNLTLRDLSLSIATYDESSLERDPSVYHGNQINFKFVKKNKESLIKIEFVT